MVILLASSQAQAAKITKVNKKRRLVTINKGKIDGFIKREVVCFFEVSGAKIGCGKVKRAKLYKAMIRVSSKLIKKIDVSQIARLKKVAEKIGIVPPKFALRFILNPTAISHIQYNQLTYATPKGETADSLWDKADGITAAPLTFGVEGDLMRYRAAVGFRGKSFRNLATSSDYDIENDDFISTKITSISYGFYVDGTAFKTASTTARQFSLRFGFDYDISNATVKGIKENYDTKKTDEIYTVNSSLSVMSLRIVPKLDWIFRSSILGISMTVLIPFSESLETKVETKDETNRAKVSDADGDFKEKFGHRTNFIGIETAISYAIPF